MSDAEITTLAYVMRAIRTQTVLDDRNGWPVPAGVAALVEDLTLRVSGGQPRTPLAPTPPAGDGGAQARLVSYQDAARVLAISTRTLKRLLAQGRLPVVRLSPGVVRIRVADLDDLVTRLHTDPDPDTT